MSDIVERLRVWPAAYGEYGMSSTYVGGLVKQAADEIEQLRAQVETARIELAALIPDPKNPTTDAWPCANPADQECLQKAFVALSSTEGK